MSKPFVCEVVKSNRVSVETTDGTSSVVVDQTVGATLTASGTGMLAKVFGDDDAKVLATSDGNEVTMSIPSLPMSVVLDPTTNTLAFNDTVGRIIANCGDFVTLASNEIDGIASSNVIFTLLSLLNNATLDPADPTYAELSNIQVPDLINSSRLNIVPDVLLGTAIDSLFTNSGVDNKPGWILLIKNTGTGVTQVLTLKNQSGAGTAGGLFFGPGDYVIPAGGGVIVLFDTHVTADGAWIVFGV